MEIRHLIKEIAEERTVILSTHILSEVQATCDYIRMIEEGQVVFAGTVEEFDNYIVPSTIFVSLASTPAVDELRMLPGVENAEVWVHGLRVNFSDSRERSCRSWRRAWPEIGSCWKFEWRKALWIACLPSFRPKVRNTRKEGL